MTENDFSNDLMYTILLRRQHTKNSGDGLQWETKKIRLLKAGTVDSLIDYLACSQLLGLGFDNFETSLFSQKKSRALPFSIMSTVYIYVKSL